jgi:hypothetical protein
MAVTGEQPTARVQHASARVGRQHDLPANPRDRGYEPYGREERVVDDQEEFVLVGEFGERWQIGDIHVRIGEPLDEETLSCWVGQRPEHRRGWYSRALSAAAAPATFLRIVAGTSALIPVRSSLGGGLPPRLRIRKLAAPLPHPWERNGAGFFASRCD